MIADIPDDEPVVRLVNCGHPPPLLLRCTGATPLTVPEPAPPLGLGWLSAVPCVPVTFPFAQGDRLLLYTDGVSETRDRDGTFYPFAERVTAWAGQTPADLVRSIGIGRDHARTPVLMLVHDLHVRVIHAATGELIRELVIDPARNYQPTGKPPGPQPKTPRTR